MKIKYEASGQDANKASWSFALCLTCIKQGAYFTIVWHGSTVCYSFTAVFGRFCIIDLILEYGEGYREDLSICVNIAL